MRACVRVCVCVCVRACVRTYVRVWGRKVCMYVRFFSLFVLPFLSLSVFVEVLKSYA